MRDLPTIHRFAAVAALAAAVSGSCGLDRSAHEEAEAAALTGGVPDVGRARIAEYGCASCHTIPGIPGADALVGPPLAGIASRAYIAGVLTNTPEEMMRWLQDPPAVDPLTAMPNVGVTPEDARHIAAYLYTLRQ